MSPVDTRSDDSDPAGVEQAAIEQGTVAEWFDATYRSRGFDYLRPLESYPIFLQLLDAKAGSELLDVACGPGLLLKAAELRGVRGSGVDISAAAVEMAGELVPNARVLESNAEELPFEDDSFDFITCIGAVERFLDRERVLGEMRRVARPTARFCFMVRNAHTLDWILWKQWLGMRNVEGHQDAASLDAWSAFFEANGFAIEGVYIDQWLRQRLRKALRGFRPRDLTRPEPVARPILPLRFANEFVFIMRHAT